MTPRPFLERLGEDSRAALRRRWLKRRLARGQTVLMQGAADRDVFFVLEGIARASAATHAGRPVSFADLRPGDIFGEFSAIDHAPRSADVVAVTEMTVARLPAAAFERLLAEDADFLWALLRHVTALSRAMNTRVFEFSTMLVRERLAAELVRLARLGAESPAGIEIAPAPTHQDIAARIGTHREAVSREMSRLAKAGMIARRGGVLVIADPERLCEPEAGDAPRDPPSVAPTV